MVIRGISIRSKLLITTLIIITLMTAFSLVVSDASNRLSLSRELLANRVEMISRIRNLEYSFHELQQNANPHLHAACIEQANQVETIITGIINHPLLAEEETLIPYARQISSSLTLFIQELSQAEGSESDRWNSAEAEILVLGKRVNQFNDAITDREALLERNVNVQLATGLLLGISITALVMLLFTLNLSKAFHTIMAFTAKLRKGILPPQMKLPPGDEIGELASDLNKHVTDLRNKINYLNSLPGQGPVEIYHPDEEDEVGKALVSLSNYLNQKELDEVSRNREDKKRNWISEGTAQIGNVLRSERENIVSLSYSVIQKLVGYMKVEMGSIFIANYTEQGNPTLELTASYAYDRRKYKNRTLEWGSGLPGACAQEKKRIFLTEIPEHYFEVSSGTGSSRPNCLLLVPMIIDDIVYGIIELATIRLLRPFEIEFVESLTESIASSMLSVQTNERTKELLQQSQEQSKILRDQEIVMTENLKKIEEAQSESRKKEGEITGILNAINQSTLMAELGLNGRYISINDQFLNLLESQADQVLGKLHTEFSQVDPSTIEYKEFWAALRKGESASNTELYRLISGKEIWLRQTFTPIFNPEGKVYKILNLAEDISETRTLQKRLEALEHEIARAGLDLQTLNEAVNTALIKCELDAEGIIMRVNEKYTQVSGYGKKELLGRNYRLFLKDAEKEQFEKIWEEVGKHKVYEGVIRRSKPTGEEVWLVSTFSPVMDEEGVIYKVYLMGFDITEKKLKYQLLEDANKEIGRLKELLKENDTE